MLSRMLGLGALVAGEVAAVVGLHLLGGLPWLALPGGDVGTWLTTSAPEDVVAALLRLAALGGAYWLVLSTAVYVLARASRLPAAVRGAEWVTVPVVRRVADRAMAVTLATSLVGGSAPAAIAGVGAGPTELPGTPLVEEVGRGPGRPVPSGGIPPPSLTPESLPDPGPAEAVPKLPDGAEEPEDATDAVGEVHVVAPGDSLWSIAATDLAEDSPRGASQLDAEEIAPHWREVVEGNRERLRSAEPDLIYPGERVALPPDGE